MSLLLIAFKSGLHMIADDRGSQISKSSAVVWVHMETHFCDHLRSCDQFRLRDYMETKVLLSAIKIYPIIAELRARRRRARAEHHC